MSKSPRLVLISGPVGVGKTTVMLEVSSQLNALGVSRAAIDMDALSWCYPTPENDPYNNEIAFENLHNLARTYSRAQDLRCVLVARVIEAADELTRFQQCFPDFEVATVRLTASKEALMSRVSGRELGSDREWSVQRAIELAGLLHVGDVEIDTSSAGVVQVAERIISLTELT